MEPRDVYFTCEFGALANTFNLAFRMACDDCQLIPLLQWLITNWIQPTEKAKQFRRSNDVLPTATLSQASRRDFHGIAAHWLSPGTHRQSPRTERNGERLLVKHTNCFCTAEMCWPQFSPPGFSALNCETYLLGNQDKKPRP